MTRPIAQRVLTGALAGIVATCTMSIAMFVTKRVGLLGEPPPRKLTRRLLKSFGVRPRKKPLALATLASHFAYGSGVGALFGLVPPRGVSALSGAGFGSAVWAVSYAGWIPKAGLMRRPSRDRSGRPIAMILAHLVYGATLGVVQRQLDARGGD